MFVPFPIQKRVAQGEIYSRFTCKFWQIFRITCFIKQFSFEKRNKNKTLFMHKNVLTLPVSVKCYYDENFCFCFRVFFNINLLYMFKIIQIAKNWNDTCVRGLEISHWKVRKYRPPLQSSQNNSPRDLRKAVVRLSRWLCTVT